jgi:hypothetical protein
MTEGVLFETLMRGMASGRQTSTHILTRDRNTLRMRKGSQSRNEIILAYIHGVLSISVVFLSSRCAAQELAHEKFLQGYLHTR